LKLKLGSFELYQNRPFNHKDQYLGTKACFENVENSSDKTLSRADFYQPNQTSRLVNKFLLVATGKIILDYFFKVSF
jgi:hypothetical protein